MQAPAGYRIRTDLDVPVMVFETETDVGPLLGYGHARQPDTDRLRVWEVAGTAACRRLPHRRAVPGMRERGQQRPPALRRDGGDGRPLAWVVDGTPPAHGSPIATDPADPTSIRRDDRGVALGGVRTPSVDVPVALLTGDSAPDAPVLCRLFGGSTPFDQATLVGLYGSTDVLVAAFDAALRPGDRRRLRSCRRSREEYAAEARAVQF